MDSEDLAMELTNALIKDTNEKAKKDCEFFKILLVYLGEKH